MIARSPEKQQRRPGGRRRYALLVAISTSMASSQLAALPPATPTGERMSPRGQRNVTDIVLGDWTKICFRPGGAKALCRTSVTGTFATGQMAIRLDIITRQDHGAERIQIFCPVGMYLPNQVELIIDASRPYRVPYTWCMANICIAGAPAPRSLIKEMTTGRMLQLRFVDSSLLQLTVSIPLPTFSSAYSGPASQTFEQDISE